MTAATHARMRKGTRLALGVVVLCCMPLFAAGCGQKGPLVLPAPPPAAGGPVAPADAADREDERTVEEARGEADGG